MKLFNTIYNVVRASDMYELIDRTNAYLDHGWSLQGGVSFIRVPSAGARLESDIWIQAIYKKRFRWIEH